MIFIVILRIISPVLCELAVAIAWAQRTSWKVNRHLPEPSSTLERIAYETHTRAPSDLNARLPDDAFTDRWELPWPRDYQPISTVQPNSHLPSSTGNGKR